MISYPAAGYVEAFRAKAIENTRGLRPYEKDPTAVDYGAENAWHAYALNATLLHDPRRTPAQVLAHGPSEAAEILLVERGSGHGVVGTFSGVSGYIGTLRPDDQEFFDPIAHTLREEFKTECGFDEQTFRLVTFYAGTATEEKRTFKPGAMITVVPILGLCTQKPAIKVDRKELKSAKWVHLASVKSTPNLARGYLGVTLPAALDAIGLKGTAVKKLLG